ncbi:MAG: D-alanyl-D-alanine carboxypeptidase family protein [Firmicutes bacterium]|nr:D-alanyl-D-alanine carboxypeptidase family protein [Bacillota bacterium]
MKRIIALILVLIMTFTFSVDVCFATAPDKPSRQKITSILPGNHKLSVMWNKVEGDNVKYLIRIATDENFTENVKDIIIKGSDNDYTKTKLVNGTKYYVKVRTFITRDTGKKIYGNWSPKKSVVVKSTAIYKNTSITGVPELRFRKKEDDGDLLVLVNKYYGLSSDYYPSDMVSVASKYSTYSGAKMKSVAYKAFKKMYNAAADKDLNFKICSAYRSYSQQRSLFNNYMYSRGASTAFILSAYPGRSEHHTGLAIDLLTGRNGWAMSNSFGNTKEGKWIKKHCAEYGFILRYPDGKTDITGYGYESWHLRYVGKDVAKEIMSNGLTLEEYLDKLPPGYKKS